jgi:hypothetical protein
LLTKVLAALVMLLTSLRFYLTAAYELSSAAGWKDAAGIAGRVLAAAALYTGLAFELEDSRRATLRTGTGRSAGRGSSRGRRTPETVATGRSEFVASAAAPAGDHV